MVSAFAKTRKMTSSELSAIPHELNLGRVQSGSSFQEKGSVNGGDLHCFLREQDVKAMTTATVQAELGLGTGCDHTSLSPAMPIS